MLPTISAQFTINSGDTVGQVINDYETEFVASTTIHNTVETTTTVLDAYPSINDCSGIGLGCTPPYQAPAARWSDTVVAPSPTVTSISPTTGPAAGGTSVTITGTNLSGATAVDFGSNAATITADSANSITATSPAGTGTVDVTVTTSNGTSATSPADQFTYVPAPTVTNVSPSAGPTGGGTSVTITGTNLGGASAVDFGSQRGDDHRRLGHLDHRHLPGRQPARST